MRHTAIFLLLCLGLTASGCATAMQGLALAVSRGGSAPPTFSEFAAEAATYSESEAGEASADLDSHGDDLGIVSDSTPDDALFHGGVEDFVEISEQFSMPAAHSAAQRTLSYVPRREVAEDGNAPAAPEPEEFDSAPDEFEIVTAAFNESLPPEEDDAFHADVVDAEPGDDWSAADLPQQRDEEFAYGDEALEEGEFEAFEAHADETISAAMASVGSLVEEPMAVDTSTPIEPVGAVEYYASEYDADEATAAVPRRPRIYHAADYAAQVQGEVVQSPPPHYDGPFKPREDESDFDRFGRQLADVPLDIRPTEGAMPADLAATEFERRAAMDMCEVEGAPPILCACSPWTICYRPLYFEDVQLERYGKKARFIQPAVSGARFFAGVAALPYNMRVRPPRSCICSNGFSRIDDYKPRGYGEFIWRWDAALIEAAAVTGFVFILP